MKEEFFWVVMSMRKWEGIETKPNLPPFSPELKFDKWFGVGFMRVFDSYEEAEKYADGEMIACVRQVNKEGTT